MFSGENPETCNLNLNKNEIKILLFGVRQQAFWTQILNKKINKKKRKISAFFPIIPLSEAFLTSGAFGRNARGIFSELVSVLNGLLICSQTPC